LIACLLLTLALALTLNLIGPPATLSLPVDDVYPPDTISIYRQPDAKCAGHYHHQKEHFFRAAVDDV
jgi:hypothetical protein